MENPLDGVSQKQRLVIIAVIAGGIGLVVYTRYKAGAAMPATGYPDDSSLYPSGGGGGGSTYQVEAPNQQVADAYEGQLRQAEVDAANLQNSYLAEQLRQGQAMFNLAQKRSEAEAEQEAMNARLQYNVAEDYSNVLRGQLDIQRSLQTTGTYKAGNVKVECGKGESMYFDINGNPSCKASGKSGIKAAGDSIGKGIIDTVNQYIKGFASQAGPAGAAQAKDILLPKKQSPANQKVTGRPNLDASANYASHPQF